MERKLHGITMRIRERISNLYLFLRCVGRYLYRGRANRAVTLPRSVVVVQFAKLGDIVCTTPMFRAIKKASPLTRVVVVGNATNKEVLMGNTDVDRYIVCGTNIESALQELKEERVEVGLSAGPSIRGFALMYLAGIPTIVAPRVEGGKNSEGRLYLLLRRLGILVPNRIGAYAPREYLKVLEPIGITTQDTTKHLVYNAEAGKAVDTFLQKEKITPDTFVVGIAASAGNKLKNWPTDRFATVADHLSAQYRAVVLIIGGKGDMQESNAMQMALAPNTRAINVSGRFSIDEFKALIARLSLFISVDTGPIYIAEAFGVPTIDIVGPMDEHEQPPVSPRNLVVVPPFKRRPVLFVMSSGDYDYDEARRQVEGITAEHVIRAVDSLVPIIRT